MHVWTLSLSLLQFIQISRQPDPLAHSAFWEDLAQTNIDRKLKSSSHLLIGYNFIDDHGLHNEFTAKRPKNVIVFIGDGMGIAMVTSARIHKNKQIKTTNLHDPLFFETFRHAGLCKTHSYDYHTTDSAASAVALLVGRKVDSETLGMEPNSRTNCTSSPDRDITGGIADLALRNGLAVGFATTTRVTHATPAALYARGLHRNLEDDVAAAERGCKKDIASQLLEYPAAQFSVIMGGGSKRLMSKSRGGKREDGIDVDLSWQRLGGSRTILRTIEDLMRFNPPANSKVLGIFSESNFPYVMEEQVKGRKTVPRLVDMTEKAIKVLQHNDKGFFLMVEGGAIDLAEHINKMHYACKETYEFEDAIRKAREMTDPEDTLIIVTADHAHALTIPGYLPSSRSLFENDRAGDYLAPGMFFATGPGYQGGFHYKDIHGDWTNPNYSLPSAIPMEYGTHGGEDVGIWADGPFSELFSGTLDNTEVAYIIKYILCINSKSQTICEAKKNTSIANMLLEIIPAKYLLDLVCILVVITIVLLIVVLILGSRRNSTSTKPIHDAANESYIASESV